MSAVASPAEQRVVLDNISWSTYLAILDDAETRRGRISYNRGVLEIMSPSKLHENVKKLFARMMEAYAEATGIEADGAGSTTFKREDLERGFEPDECYDIKNADAVLGEDELDLAIDPPPDLALEIDISRTAVGKFGIYQALGIPEIWRYYGEEFEIFILKSGEYVKANQSGQLPGFPVQVAYELLEQRAKLNQSEIIRRFRKWLSENVAS